MACGLPTWPRDIEHVPVTLNAGPSISSISIILANFCWHYEDFLEISFQDLYLCWVKDIISLANRSQLFTMLRKDQRRGYITSLELGVGTEATEAVGLFPSGQAQLAKLPAGELK